jgi:hypothetical protein
MSENGDDSRETSTATSPPSSTRVIGVRFELNDPTICVIAEWVDNQRM